MKERDFQNFVYDGSTTKATIPKKIKKEELKKQMKRIELMKKIRSYYLGEADE